MKQGMADAQETTERREGRGTGTMAEQTDEKTAFVIPSEPFSQIVVSGLGTPLDAELSQLGHHLPGDRPGGVHHTNDAQEPRPLAHDHRGAA